MAPKHSRSDVVIRVRQRLNVFPFSENVKVLELIRKGNKSYAEVAKIYSKKESSVCEIVKKKKEIHASCAVSPHTAKY